MDKALLVKDALDRKIIASLQANARQSTASIAAALGVARTTVHERISRMEERGVIKGYSVVLGQADETPMVQVIVQLSVNQPETAKIISRIGAYLEVKQCLSVNGEFDLIIIAEAPRIEDLDVLTDEFGAIPGVIRTKTHVVFSRRIDRN
ncbi:MAG: Lrp/AsnC family transcriptional regulator [Cognatishimia sp.]|uniref:Lrp/AsnC family transcriptional regulator n=1 Tax=Cognatishimia sp. TaxID=2211648 RepID=UPI003B8E065A